MTAKPGDLSVTALYTSQVWVWGGLSHAYLLANQDAKRVFDVTNAVLAALRMFNHKLAPLRHSLLHRHTMIDHLLRESGDRYVIELAAGFSRRGAAASSDAHVTYTELDLPTVVERKRELLSALPRVARCSRGRDCASSRVTSRPRSLNRSCDAASRSS